MDGGNWTTIILSMIGGGGMSALITAFIAWRKSSADIKQSAAQTDKMEAETAEIITRANEKVLIMMRCQLDNVQAANDKMRIEIAGLNIRVAELEQLIHEIMNIADVLYEQLVENKIEPKLKPPERTKKNR